MRHAQACAFLSMGVQNLDPATIVEEDDRLKRLDNMKTSNSLGCYRKMQAIAVSRNRGSCRGDVLETVIRSLGR